MQEIEADSEKKYSVKIYHAQNQCDNSGASEIREIVAINNAQLRVKVETTSGEFFRGECCKKCGERGKISIT